MTRLAGILARVLASVWGAAVPAPSARGRHFPRPARPVRIPFRVLTPSVQRILDQSA